MFETTVYQPGDLISFPYVDNYHPICLILETLENGYFLCHNITSHQSEAFSIAPGNIPRLLENYRGVVVLARIKK